MCRCDPTCRTHSRLCEGQASQCRRVLPHASTERLGRSLHALDVLQAEDMEGEDSLEQEEERRF